MNREQLAWAAGIIDGEGYIANARNKHKLQNGTIRTYLSPAIKVAQTAKYGGIPDMVERLFDLFDGSRLSGPYQRNKPGHAEVYEWKVYSFERVQAILCMIWPWLGKQKQQDALNMLGEYHENRPPMEWRRGPRQGYGHKPDLSNRRRDELGRLLPNESRSSP